MRFLFVLVIAFLAFCAGVNVSSQASRPDPDSSEVTLWPSPAELAAAIRPGLRAVSIPMTQDRAAGGFVHPGGVVNVVVGAGARADAQAVVLLRQRRVLAVNDRARVGERHVERGSRPQARAGEPPFPESEGVARIEYIQSVTLEVSPEEAEKLVLANAHKPLYLVLVKPEAR